MKSQYSAFILIAVIVLGFAGAASAAGEPASKSNGVVSNIWFAKMTKTNGTYAFDVQPTLYTGLNDYGRMTFITGSENLSTGNYAILEETPKGLALLKVVQLTKPEMLNPDYTMLTLELTKEDLLEPLYIPDATGATSSLNVQVATPSPSTTPSPAATTKAPLSMVTILAGLCIAGVFGITRLRR
jgi:hypothetical protein